MVKVKNQEQRLGVLVVKWNSDYQGWSLHNRVMFLGWLSTGKSSHSCRSEQ